MFERKLSATACMKRTLRIPAQVKRPNTGAKAKCKECPVRGSKSDQPAASDPHNPRVYENGKNVQEGAANGELKKFDGAGYDSDSVNILERHIMSRNPNSHW